MPAPVTRFQRGHAAQIAIAAQRPIASVLGFSNEHVSAIEESHSRCVALGVARIGRPDFSPIGHPDLNVARERNLRLHQHAAPVMEMLYNQIINTGSMVALTDASGTILHSFGDGDFLGRAAKVALTPGTNWSESAKGTNAVGTALVSELPTLVHADEHYLHANHFLTCSAAPILDPRGNILGVLDVSGDHHSYHQHTMALVKMSARMIENHWLTDDYRHVMRVHFHSRADFIGTLMEGILAITADGRLVGANRGAIEQLGLSGAALRMHSLSSLFDTSVDALVDRFRSPMATPMPVHSHDRKPWYLHARFNWPVWTSLADAVALAPVNAAVSPFEAGATAALTSPVNTLPGQAQPSGLAALRSGDVQMECVLDKVARVLDQGINILVLGNAGTGRQTLARAVHADSRRAQQPFVAFDCSATDPALIETELFGYQAANLGGARRKALVGKVVQATGGTLFINEIGDLPMAAQGHLLRVLSDGKVTPLGDRRAVAVDIALVCSSRHNLRERIQDGLFRDDLFYRLNGLAVRLPDLQERSDGSALVRRILDSQSRGAVLELDAQVQLLFKHYTWPGNLRQLSNVLHTASVMACGHGVIACHHLPDDFLEEAQRCLETAARVTPPSTSARPALAADSRPALSPVTAAPPMKHVTRSLEAVEIEAIARAVEAAGGNISQASKQLGVSRNTIYRKLRWNART